MGDYAGTQELGEMMDKQVKTETTVKIKVALSKPILEYVEKTTRQDQTKSQRIEELLEIGLKESVHNK
jgi:hypothetical protein